MLKSFERAIAVFVSGVGKERINQIRSDGYNYFEDLKSEYRYLLEWNGKNAGGRTYRLCSMKSDLESDTQNVVKIIVTIEGAHALCSGTDTENPDNWIGVEDRIDEIKAWDFPPLFITLAHHFYNGICTHAKSLFGAPGKLLDQDRGCRDYDFKPNDGLNAISQLGIRVIDKLLETGEGKRRIHLDVKHMSKEARSELYRYLKERYPEEYIQKKIPIIFSHGAVSLAKTGFYRHQINLEPELDLSEVYATDGMVGIELDQRILGYRNYHTKTWIDALKGARENQRIEAKYIWNQIQAIAEYAYSVDQSWDPWRCICIGSDLDGIINPLDRYRNIRRYPILQEHLTHHLDAYWKHSASVIPRNHHGTPGEVIGRIMKGNLHEFILRVI